jgi:hypothetical protein
LSLYYSCKLCIKSIVSQWRALEKIANDKLGFIAVFVTGEFAWENAKNPNFHAIKVLNLPGRVTYNMLIIVCILNFEVKV